MEHLQVNGIKKHSEKLFWEGFLNKAVMISKPSMLVFEDKGYILPQLNLIERKD